MKKLCLICGIALYSANAGARVQSQTIPHHVPNNQNLAVADTVKLRIRIRHHTEHARAR